MNDPLISIIIPTKNKSDYLDILINIFNNQTYINKELLIYDDSTIENKKIKEYSVKTKNIYYFYSNEPVSIGYKRNILIEKAKGEFIAHFDENTYYISTYIEKLYNYINYYKVSFINIKNWFCYFKLYNLLTYVEFNKNKIDENHLQIEKNKLTFININDYHKNRMGKSYGFKYMYKKKLCNIVKFDDVDFGEDYLFINKIELLGNQIKYISDTEGLCLHIINNNTYSVFPKYIIPIFLLKTLFPKYISL